MKKILPLSLFLFGEAVAVNLGSLNPEDICLNTQRTFFYMNFSNDKIASETRSDIDPTIKPLVSLKFDKNFKDCKYILGLTVTTTKTGELVTSEARIVLLNLIESNVDFNYVNMWSTNTTYEFENLLLAKSKATSTLNAAVSYFLSDWLSSRK